jgi:nitrous oxidase accessory protein NosD
VGFESDGVLVVLRSVIRRIWVRPSFAILALALVGAARVEAEYAPAASRPEITIEHDDIDITSSVTVKPGTYHVKDLNGDGVLHVKADGVFVQMKDVVLDGASPGETPESHDGIGVSVVGKAKVTILSGSVSGYRVGIRGEDAEHLTIVGVNASRNRRMHLRSTPEREDASDWLWPHENDDGQWEKNYGAGLSLTRCKSAYVGGCQIHDGQNGLLLSRCDHAHLNEDDFSFNSGWGVAMWRTSDAYVECVRCDWCVRGYSDGIYARGQDSAGFLVFEQCSNNRFLFNSATHSGDGFFLYAGNETLKRTGAGGCNGNTVTNCDFSDAVANGIEATFSDGNRFERNRLDRCDHGVWAGYSYRTSIVGNVMKGCANGVSIEHGHENRIEKNAIEDCATGVHLWWNNNVELMSSAFGKTHSTDSASNVIAGNWIADGGVGILLDGDTGAVVEGNHVAPTLGPPVRLTGTTAGLTMARNNLVAGKDSPSVANDTGADVVASENWWGEYAPRFVGKGAFSDGRPSTAPWPIQRPPTQSTPGIPPGSWHAMNWFQRNEDARGRQLILIDEWGPVDPWMPRLFPAVQAATGSASVTVLGVGFRHRWSVTSITEGFFADRTEGAAPATIHIRRSPSAMGPSLAPFDVKLRVKIADTDGFVDLSAKGSLLSTRWATRFWKWEKDPRTDRAAFDALVATKPLVSRETDALDFANSGSPAEGVPADHFATVAESSLDLPAGTWRLRVLSDDGVRVLVDGKPVFEDWTWHGPKEDVVDLALAAGKHAVRVEHFELDGYAALRCSVEPVIDRR